MTPKEIARFLDTFRSLSIRGAGRTHALLRGAISTAKSGHNVAVVFRSQPEAQSIPSQYPSLFAELDSTNIGRLSLIGMEELEHYKGRNHRTTILYDHSIWELLEPYAELGAAVTEFSKGRAMMLDGEGKISNSLERVIGRTTR